MDSAHLTRSRTWDGLAPGIAKALAAGVPWEDVHELHVAIDFTQGLEPYRKHRARLDEVLWPGDAGPGARVVDLGAGYGAMATFWPEGAIVYNVDLPEMLEVQAAYLLKLGAREIDSGGWRTFHKIEQAQAASVTLVPFTEADRVPIDGAYLYSTWALTETTPETWEYWIERAPRLAGAYVLGHRTWGDVGQPWPWAALGYAFERQSVEQAEQPDAVELVGRNPR